MKKTTINILLIAVFVIIVLWIISSVSTVNKADKAAADLRTTEMNNYKDTLGTAAKQAPPPEPVSNWKPGEAIDEMDNTKRTWTSVQSTNTLTFEWPYGESSFELTVRKWKGSTDVFITCKKCQFLKGILGDKTYRLKFDDEKPIRVTASGSSSGGSEIVFLGSAQTLIKKLRTAKKLTVEAEFYESGYQNINFNIENFQWK